MKPASRILLATAVFLVLLVACRRLELLVMRELYALAETAGLLPRNPVGAMQILGRYVPGPPQWLRATVRFAGAFAGIGPALWIALVVHRRLATGRAFGRILGDRAGWTRLTLSTVVFAMLVLPSEQYLPGFVGELVLKAGAVAGCEYSSAGSLIVSEEGPFFAGPLYGGFNFAWRWLPWLAAYLPPFLVALACDHRIIQSLIRPGRCVRCDYRLDRNTSGVCPECGTAIE